jgi:hypothetical protein
MRKLTKMQDINRGDRSLIESIMMPEVIVALRDWARSTGSGVLVGVLGLSYHCKPRYTQDIDFLFLEPSDVPDAVGGFSQVWSGFGPPVNFPLELPKKLRIVNIGRNCIIVVQVPDHGISCPIGIPGTTSKQR